MSTNKGRNIFSIFLTCGTSFWRTLKIYDIVTLQLCSAVTQEAILPQRRNKHQCRRALGTDGPKSAKRGEDKHLSSRPSRNYLGGDGLAKSKSGNQPLTAGPLMPRWEFTMSLLWPWQRGCEPVWDSRGSLLSSAVEGGSGHFSCILGFFFFFFLCKYRIHWRNLAASSSWLNICGISAKRFISNLRPHFAMQQKCLMEGGSFYLSCGDHMIALKALEDRLKGTALHRANPHCKGHISTRQETVKDCTN